MSTKESKRKYIRRKMLSKYRLVFMDDETLEERASLRLSRLNVFVVGTLFAITMVVLTTLFIIYTPLREYILGFSEVQLKRQTVELNFKVDSLEKAVRTSDAYFASIQKVLTGDITPDKINRDSILQNIKANPAEYNLMPSRQDSILRMDVTEEERYNVFQKAVDRNNDQLLFAPIEGEVSNDYNPEKRHYGIDIVAKEGMPVKVVADGTVIFADWTLETGYSIIVEHKDNLISVYKHNSSLTKKQGSQVRTGEVIATVGNTGELTTGPHLHFELWSNGYPVNPRNYIEFK
ncbi:MAG: M23 family metallopeptidase [Capnocytophaga sp.]|nr:M23 family metallopeptidase [Capnocytophaga sp.]